MLLALSLKDIFVCSAERPVMMRKKKMSDKTLLHQLGYCVHGFLVFGHALGTIYNIKKKNWLDIIIHGSALIYSAKSVHGHLKDSGK